MELGFLEISAEFYPHRDMHLSSKSLTFKTYGAQGRNRTTDTVIFSHVLYQLSYLGAPVADRTAFGARGL
jgi:hypothetical protein